VDAVVQECEGLGFVVSKVRHPRLNRMERFERTKCGLKGVGQGARSNACVGDPLFILQDLSS